MTVIENQIYEGERPLFFKKDLKLEHIKVLNGESAIKEGSNITCNDSYFNGKYPFWHIQKALITNCTFDTNARAAIWYSSDLSMSNCKIIAPKMFRRCVGVFLDKVEFTDAQETLWDCKNISVDNSKIVNGDYLLQNSLNIKVNNLDLQGNYAFQNCTNVTVSNCTLNSKDAFWEAKNVVVDNCTLDGEYLAWHSENVIFRNCKIKGTQPLCYAKGLILENCSFDEDCDLAFEYSDVKANINGAITSVKNPITGYIRAQKIKQIILDEYQRVGSNCVIEEA